MYFSCTLPNAQSSREVLLHLEIFGLSTILHISHTNKCTQLVLSCDIDPIVSLAGTTSGYSVDFLLRESHILVCKLVIIGMKCGRVYNSK